MQQFGKYVETSLETLDKGQIVVKLYEGAIRFLNKAIFSIAENDFKSKGDNIARAIAIINELNWSLDMEASTEISTNLRDLYNFFVRHLNDASIQCDIKKIEQVIFCLEELHGGWRKIAC